MTSILRLKVYFKLGRKSQMAMARRKKGWGRAYSYNPQGRLVRRVAAELGWTPEKVRQEIQRERALLLANPTALVYEDFS